MSRPLPPPADLEAPVGELIDELGHYLGHYAVAIACELLAGADPREYVDVLPWLTGLPGDDAVTRPEPWPRVWGARALLYVWDDSAAGLVLTHLDDDAWRVAEMCLKVSTRRELAAAADAAVRLSRHELARVRGQAMRLLGVAGDTEHVEAVKLALTDEDEAVRRHADRALELMTIRLDLP